MSNYPAGSMRGSGIYQQEIEAKRECPTCERKQNGLIIVDDFGYATWVCEVCEGEVEVEDDRDDDEPYWPEDDQ